MPKPHVAGRRCLEVRKRPYQNYLSMTYKFRFDKGTKGYPRNPTTFVLTCHYALQLTFNARFHHLGTLT